MATLMLLAGSWDYGWRFSADADTSWTYANLGGTGCGGNGTTDAWNDPGTLTVLPVPYRLALYAFEGELPTPRDVPAHLAASDFAASGTATRPAGNGSVDAISHNGWNVAMGTT